jgi:hypothetical protein
MTGVAVSKAAPVNIPQVRIESLVTAMAAIPLLPGFGQTIMMFEGEKAHHPLGSAPLSGEDQALVPR